jgi:hypothetical protein
VLARTGVPWMVIGGIAVIARGVRRMTADIDAVVRGDQTNVAALLRDLAARRIVPRINDVEAFAGESLVLLLRHEPTGVEFDLSLAWTAFEHEALEARSDTKYGAVVAPMAAAEDLVIFKAMAARPRDIEDAAALLLMHKDIDLDRVRRHLAQLAALAEEPSLAGGLEAVIALSRSVGKPGAPARAKQTEPARRSAKASRARASKSAAPTTSRSRTGSLDLALAEAQRRFGPIDSKAVAAAEADLVKAARRGTKRGRKRTAT